MSAAGSSTLDVVVVGDGPAGAALAHACAEVDLETIVVGRGKPWTNTYAAWVDELPELPDSVWAARTDQVIAGGAELRRIDRAYGVFDNIGLRCHLGLDRRLCSGTATELIDDGDGAAVVLANGERLCARWVVDARGAPPAEPAAWQTAYGVIVDEPVAATVAATDAATLMDWSWSGTIGAPSFLYVVPLGDRWLIEHTVLAASPAVDPIDLRPPLADRLGESVIAAAEAAGDVELVRIPLGVPAGSGVGRIVRFGAAAGMANPATGYSVAASLAAAPRVAHAVALGTGVHEAVWPSAARRARALHQYGLDVLRRLDPASTARFFDVFFRLPAGRWAPYLRVDTTPSEVAGVMRGVFAVAPWSVRRRLASGDPRLVRGLFGR